MIDQILSIVYQYRWTIFISIGLVIISWLYNQYRVNRPFFTSNHSMIGKTVLIIGGVSGIGYETAKDLLQRGARVILTSYNMEKGSHALKQLRIETNCHEMNIRLMKCDLRSFESVRQFVQLYNEEEQKLDVLICNAGIVWAPNLITKDGINTVIQLKQCRPSRIVFVASGSHRIVRTIDWTDAFTQYKNFRLWGAYPVSKAFMLLFAHKLKQDLHSNDVDVFAVNPSWVWTSIQSPMREAFGLIPFLICYPILYILKCILSKTPKTGARTTIFCAVEPTLQHSHHLYFEDCAVETVSSLCKNNALANQLWEYSCAAVEL